MTASTKVDWDSLSTAEKAIRTLQRETWLPELRSRVINLITILGQEKLEADSEAVGYALEVAASLLFPLQEVERQIERGTEGNKGGAS